VKTRLRIYSDILQLRTSAFEALKLSPAGIRYAVWMFFVVTLIAGAGIWIALPATLQHPSVSELIDDAQGYVTQFENEVAPSLDDSLDSLSEENISRAIDDALASAGESTSEALSGVAAKAKITGADLANTLTASASSLGAEARAVVEQQADALRAEAVASGYVTADQIESLQESASLTAEQVGSLLARAGAARSQLSGLSATLAQRVPGIEGMLDRIPLSVSDFQTMLARIAISPVRLKGLVARIGLSPDQIAALRNAIRIGPKEITRVLDSLQVSLEKYSPPLGTQFSRVIRMLGHWIATPFGILATWSLFGLLLLVVMHLLGGAGNLRQHVTGLLLASAPFVLLLFYYTPNVTPAMSVPMDMAINVFGRVLAVIAFAWAALILIKSMAVTHDVSMWRSLGGIALTWVVLFVVLPALGFMAGAYIVAG
jgi:hypothetical protein